MADGGDVAYSFPTLNSKKIAGYLSDLQIQIPEEVRDTQIACTINVVPLALFLLLVYHDGSSRSHLYNLERTSSILLGLHL